MRITALGFWGLLASYVFFITVLEYDRLEVISYWVASMVFLAADCVVLEIKKRKL